MTEFYEEPQAYNIGRSPTSLGEKARLSFIKKVYSLLTIQLAFTIFMVAVATTSRTFRNFQAGNQTLLYLSMAVTIGTSLAMTFCGLSKKFPANYGLLTAFTLAEGYIVSFICTMYEPSSVLACGVLTLGITVGLTLHALTTKKDYSAWLGGLVGIGFALLALSFLNFFIRLSFINNLIAVAFCLIYMVYIVVDTQLILGGSKRQYGLSLDDYIMGTMLLYVDIVGLFLQLLKILGKEKKRQ